MLWRTQCQVTRSISYGVWFNNVISLLTLVSLHNVQDLLDESCFESEFYPLTVELIILLLLLIIYYF